MSRLAVLAFTLTVLPWSGESFISTIASSTSTTTASHLPQSYETIDGQQTSIQRIRGRPYARQRRSAQDSHPPFSSPIVYSILSYRSSSSLLNAAFLGDPSSSGPAKRSGRGRRSNGSDKKDLGWHRRIFGKISWRRESRGQRGGSESSSSLPSSSTEQEEAQTGTVESFALYEAQNQKKGDDFLVRDFDLLVPETVLPIVQVDQKKPHSFSLEVDPKVQKRSIPPLIDDEYFDVSITPAVSSTETMQDTSLVPELATTIKTPASTKKGMICRLLENILMEKISERWATETPNNLKIDVRTSPDKFNNIGRLLFRQLFRADATLSSDRIVFPNIRFSSVHLEMEKVTLNLMGFFLSNNDNNNDGGDNRGRLKRQPNDQRRNQTHRESPINTSSVSTSSKTTGKVRYPKQFDLHIEDLTMSRHDLLFSSCIKNGLRQLLINVLKDRGVRSDSIRITSIDILHNGKISCIGEAKMHFPSAPVHFEVRTGISFSNRGHVLTFPGMEVSLNRDIGFFVPVHPMLDLDVGHNTKFRSIVIDGFRKRLKIAASVTITPDRTRLMQDYVQTSDAFSAIFFYDIGQWLTRMGRFSK